MSDPFDTTTVELPDGTCVEISLRDDGTIVYEVTPGQEGLSAQASYYDAADARRQAQTIREREARSWDTIFPEQVEPVLDVARALDRAASAAESE